MEIIRYGLPEDYIEIDAPITEVTITEDQADIARETRIEWEKGSLNILIKDVTSYIIDKTMWTEITTDGIKPDIGSTRCIRWFVPADKTNKEKELRILKDMENLYLKIEELFHKHEKLRNLRYQIYNSMEPSIRTIMEKIVFNEIMPESYSSIIDNMLDEVEKNSDDSYELHKIYEEYYEQWEKLKREWNINITNRNAIYKQAGILISMEAKEKGTGMLKCGYQVPCSQWRPQHEGHLIEDNKILFITQGIVWQNTGEDWNDIKLTLSTAKPSLGLDVILPCEDMLQLREKTKEEQKKIQVQIRDQVIQNTGVGEPDMEEPPLPSDGGETQFYRVPEKVSLKSGRNPNLIKLEEFEMSGETALQAIPETDRHVFLISQVKNNRERPVLAGPILLHRKGTFIGTGQIDFVGSNEPFHIWWGSEDMLQIERYVDKKTEEATLFQSKRIITHTVTLYIRNIAGEKYTFRIQERLPVSELEQVKVKMKRIPPNCTEPDKNGFIYITVNMEPVEEKSIVFSYVMEMDKQVDYR